jgi:hypothetical protein
VPERPVHPGGVGHHWIKAKFISPAPMGFTPLRDPDTGGDVMFIPSKLTDNHILLASDPDYANRLRGLGSPELVRALRDHRLKSPDGNDLIDVLIRRLSVS